MKHTALRILALVGASVVAVAAWVAAATIRAEFWVLAVVALVAFLAAAMLFLTWADRLGEAEGARGRWVWLGVGAVAYISLAHLTVGRAPDRILEEPAPPPEIGLWGTPDGGHLAYLQVSHGEDPHPTPVIFLHGGPGTPVLPTIADTGVEPLAFLAPAGHPVYYYDQRGSGFSSRLDLRRGDEYTVARHVADLEAVRAALGADRIIPVGHGWGATLAIQYLLAHPERVERVIALAPAPLWYPAFEDVVDPAARARVTEVQASALALLERPPLRLVVGRLTASASRSAAHSLVEDWEADQWWTRATETAQRLGQPNMTCSTDPARGLPPLSGLGFFAHSYTLADALRLPDSRPALASLDTPVLVARGLCDYIRWQVAYEYLQVLPGAVYVSIPAGGHLLWLEQEELMARVILPFLAGEPVPLSYYHPSPHAGIDGTP